MLVARISLTLFCHFSLSFIASGRSSGQHPVSSHSCWMYVHAGRPAFARPCVGVHNNTSLMSSSLLLQQCPACLVRLTWIVFVIGGRWPYSWCLLFDECIKFYMHNHIHTWVVWKVMELVSQFIYILNNKLHYFLFKIIPLESHVLPSFSTMHCWKDFSRMPFSSVMTAFLPTSIPSKLVLLMWPPWAWGKESHILQDQVNRLLLWVHCHGETTMICPATTCLLCTEQSICHTFPCRFADW